MSRMITELLESDSDLSSFNCANSSINALVKESFFATIVKQGRAYRALVDGKTIGYYMLSFATVNNYTDTCCTECFGTQFAAVKINFFAVDKRYQRKGLGGRLIGMALEQAQDLCKKLPVRFISLNALAEKEKWYSARGFEPYGNKPTGSENTVTMFVDLIDEGEMKNYVDDHV